LKIYLVSQFLTFSLIPVTALVLIVPVRKRGASGHVERLLDVGGEQMFRVGNSQQSRRLRSPENSVDYHTGVRGDL
jgi:hypothetical protein